ncbi:hypothetical protein [Streptomyces sp. NBC_00158]|uniref:hypothetical protein n=1 Tax=Streptomyces sp. NBC_00158 TaxID=2903627 RepID=UPI0032491327
MAWDLTSPYYVGPKGTVPVWVTFGSPGQWRYTYIQARPYPNTLKQPLFVMNQAVRVDSSSLGGPVGWGFGADVYNPNDVWIQFTLHGV